MCIIFHLLKKFIWSKALIPHAVLVHIRPCLALRFQRKREEVKSKSWKEDTSCMIQEKLQSQHRNRDGEKIAS